MYNVHCSPSTNVDVGESASVKAEAVIESPKLYNNVSITELNLIANNLANNHKAQVFLSVLWVNFYVLMEYFCASAKKM